jgi:putative DNA primase/helicase
MLPDNHRHLIPKDPAAPFILASRDDLVLARLVHDRAGPFRTWNGAWFRRVENRWSQIDDGSMIEHVHSVMSQGSMRQKRGAPIPLDRSDAAMSAVVKIMSRLPTSVRNLPPHLLPLLDCILDTQTGQVAEADGSFAPATIPLTRAQWDARAEPRRWLEFLSMGFSHKPDIDILQEFFGYLLYPEQPYQRGLWLYGQPSSGKSTILTVAQMLVGEPWVWSGDAARLGGRWTGTLPRARAIVFPDYRQSRDSSKGLAFVLNIIGGDAVQVEQKYLDPITVRPTGKVLFASNEMPRFQDGTGAALRRLLMIQRNGTWVGRQDPKLLDHLLAELPGILAWAIQGLHRLLARGDFDLKAVNPRLARHAARSTNYVLAFAQDTFDLVPLIEGDETFVPMRSVLEAYRSWCASTNNRAILSQEDLAVALKQTLGSQIKGVEHSSGSGYRGIRLKETP